jgi:2-aminoadipate transaminase
MRLNFSGVSDDAIREGVRRIGEVIREQLALYGRLTGAEPAPSRASEPAREAPASHAPAAEAPDSQVLPLRRKAG